jgi:hypothetical protein
VSGGFPPEPFAASTWVMTGRTACDAAVDRLSPSEVFATRMVTASSPATATVRADVALW